MTANWKIGLVVPIIVIFGLAAYTQVRLDGAWLQVSALKKDVKILKKQIQEREEIVEAKHQRSMLKTRIGRTKKLLEALIVIQGKQAQDSIMARGELIRILGLFPYNHSSLLTPQSKNAKTIYSRFRSWRGRKGYHFCCIARGPNEKNKDW